jgi:hypothetical protein
MTFKTLIAQGAIAVALGSAAFGAGVAPANADPDWEPWDHDEWVDRDWNDQWRDWDNDRWDKWWRAHRWRNDDRPPWGWGRPPAVYWRGHPPPVYDYWGYRVHPVWHPGFHTWGFWLFGIFIPIVVI